MPSVEEFCRSTEEKDENGLKKEARELNRAPNLGVL